MNTFTKTGEICQQRNTPINKVEGESVMNFLKKVDLKKTGLFAAGVLFGTAGIKILASKDAKKVYTHCTAAVLRAKECVMNTVSSVQENVEDIYAEAQLVNELRAEEKMEFQDASEEIFEISDEEAEVQQTESAEAE